MLLVNLFYGRVINIYQLYVTVEKKVCYFTLVAVIIFSFVSFLTMDCFC